MMKKTTIIILVLLMQFLLLGQAQARCNLELFHFGSSVKDLNQDLRLTQEEKISATHDRYKQTVSLPGEMVCQGEKYLEDALVDFVFLDGKLVETRTTKPSKQPTLVYWVESIYGEKKRKPNTFYAAQPQAYLLWESSNAVVAYSITSNDKGIFESVIIQSKNHQRYFAKNAELEEMGVK
jgi:hypothetical protein